MSGVYYQEVIARLRRENEEAYAELASVRDQLAALDAQLVDPGNVSPLRQLGRVNRLEVHDRITGDRPYVLDGGTFTAALQDGGHTLKVYVK